MIACCRCVYGHLFNSRVVAVESDTGYFEVEDGFCPECDSVDKPNVEFAVVDLDTFED